MNLLKAKLKEYEDSLDDLIEHECQRRCKEFEKVLMFLSLKGTQSLVQIDFGQNQQKTFQIESADSSKIIGISK